MTNPFYTATGAPVQESRGTSPAVRNEFALLQTAFDEVADAIDIGAASGTSTTSLLVGTGSKSFTIQAGRAFSPGQSVVLAYNVTPTTQMTGTITSYNRTTGAVVMNVTGTNGSGTYADWTLSLSPSSGAALGANIFTGAQDWATGANIASASTVNLDTATGNRVHITGTTTITAWTLTRGPRTVIFDGALQLTYNATTNRLNSNGANVTVNAGDMAYIESDGTTVYVEVIRANGSPISTDQLFGTVGTAQVITAASSNNDIAICQLSATLAMVIYRNASGFPQAAIVDQTGAKVSGHMPIQLEAAASQATMQVIRVSATTAIAVWGNGTNAKAVHLTVSGNVITAGSVLAASSDNCNAVSICLLTSTKFIIAYYKISGDALCARTLTLSGTTLTANTEYTLAFGAGGGLVVRLAAMSSTQALATFCGSSLGSVAQGLVITEASNVLTFPSHTSYCTTGSANTTGAGDIVSLTATRAVAVVGSEGGNTGYGNALVVDFSGTGYSATMNGGRPTMIAPGGSTIGHRVALLSSATVLHLGPVGASLFTSVFLEALAISGDGVFQGASVLIARTTGIFDLCVLSSTTALVAYVDSSNSNYPTVKPVALGTVV